MLAGPMVTSKVMYESHANADVGMNRTKLRLNCVKGVRKFG